MKRIALALLLAVSVAPHAYGSSYDDLNAGIQFYSRGEWSAAIEHLDKALATDELVLSLKFIAYFDRAQSHMGLSQYDLAIADYSAGLAIRPGEIEVLTRRSNAYAKTGNVDMAIADLNEAITARPKLGSTYWMRATLHMKRGQAEKSREDLKKMLSLVPTTNTADMNIGIASWMADQIEDADKFFSSASDKYQSYMYAWLWHALTELRLGKNVPRDSAPSADPAVWPSPLVNFFLGKVTQDTVFANARQGEENVVNGNVCEANFYLGEWLLQHHDQAGAKTLISTAAGSCPSDFIEWMPAQMYQSSAP